MFAATAEQQSQFFESLSDYWVRSRRPYAAFVFVLPLLLLYEAGVLILGPGAVRNGADLWLRQWLEIAGFADNVQYFLLPVLVAAILVAWHHLLGQPWEISRPVLGWMFMECLILSVLLVGVAHLQGTILRQMGCEISQATVETAVGANVATEAKTCVARLVGYFGAGIYEEALFRLLLLTASWGLLRMMFGPGRWTAVTAVITTSLLFSLAHYVGPRGEVFSAHTFTFRFLAGSFFATLFVSRGFGVAAGTHAGYDILVGLLY